VYKVDTHADGTWPVQLFLPGSWQLFLLGPCPRGPHPGDGAGHLGYSAFTDYCLDRFELLGFCFYRFSLIFSFLCRVLDYAGHIVSFWAHVNLRYRIVRYRTNARCALAYSIGHCGTEIKLRPLTRCPFRLTAYSALIGRRPDDVTRGYCCQ